MYSVFYILGYKNKGHDFLVLENLCKIKKNDIKQDFKELEEVIYPTYDDIANSLENQIANLDEEYKQRTAIVTKREEEWHSTIFSVVNEIKKRSDNKVKHRNILLKHLSDVRKTETLIRDSLSAFKELDESNVVS